MSVRGDAQLVAQAAGLRDRGDLVDDDGSHRHVVHARVSRHWLAGARVEDAGQRQHLGEAVRLGRGPFARGLAVGALRGLHQRVGRGHAFDEHDARAAAAGAPRRSRAAARRRSSASMSRHTGSRCWPSCTRSPYGPASDVLDALLPRRQHQLLELAVRGEQDLGGRRLEGDAALDADDRVAEVDAAADAEASRRSCSSRSISVDRRSSDLPSRAERARPVSKPIVCRSAALRLRRTRRCDSTQALSGMLPFEVERLLAADRHAPEAAVDRVGGADTAAPAGCAAAGTRAAPGRLKALVAHRREDLELRRERAQRHLEAHLVVAGGGAAVRDHVRAELARQLRDGLRLQHALGADAQRIEVAAPHVAHDQEPQHLLEVRGPRVDEVMRDGAQRLRALVPASCAAAASMPPVLTVT